jgi:hypothetical protein
LTCDAFQHRSDRVFFDSIVLLAAAERVSVVFVKKGILAMLAVMLVLHASLGCGISRAETLLIKAPCCGANCPVPSSVGDRACCQGQESGAAAEAVSAKPTLPSLQLLAVLIHKSSLMPAPVRFEWASVLQATPLGATKLALLCSRQI